MTRNGSISQHRDRQRTNQSIAGRLDFRRRHFPPLDRAGSDTGELSHPDTLARSISTRTSRAGERGKDGEPWRSRARDVHVGLGREPGVGRATPTVCTSSTAPRRRCTGSTMATTSCTRSGRRRCRPASCPTDDGVLVGVLHDGLYVIDPDARHDARCSPVSRRARRPVQRRLRRPRRQPHHREAEPRTRGRLGVVVLGRRRLASHRRDISNTNGPAVGVLDGAMTLIIGDTSADYFSYPYDPETGAVGTAVGVRRHERARRSPRRLHAGRRRRALVRARRRRPARPLHDARARSHAARCRSPTRPT